MNIGNFTWLDGGLAGLALFVSVLMLQRRVRRHELWRATVTPLASIIGSGFLIMVPLLATIVGSSAGMAMLGIILLSLWLGSALRFNISHEGADPTLSPVPFAAGLERTSELALAIAYAISIAFYIRLMSAFLLTGLDAFTNFNADILATLIVAFIGIYGAKRGLSGLERLEVFSVTIKLSIIAALLFGLSYYHVALNGDALDVTVEPETSGWERLRLLGGMLLIVQGFETSKYLASAYAPPVRVRSMFLAQILAGAIYITFVYLAMPLVASVAASAPSETGIIEITGQVTLVLPLMLIVAAVMSQFSAAIADTIGAGGVIETESRRRISARGSYPIIAIAAVVLIWTSHVFEMVSLASRAFALYYLCQTLRAALLSAAAPERSGKAVRVPSFLALSAVMLAIVLFAKPVEV